jgi:hypothetical protein
MLVMLLNFSPPCAANAARASSIGVLLAVIAGPVAVAAGVVPFDPSCAGVMNAADKVIASIASPNKIRLRITVPFNGDRLIVY